jgi:hypothetical protein
MKTPLHALAAMLAATVAGTVAAEEASSGRRASHPGRPAWEFGLTAYPTYVRDGENYTSVIAVADRGPLHLEARYDYESIGARSAFVGWTFSGGEDFTWELTPLLGGVWGTTRGFVPGLEASLGWGPLDFYLEGEYVRSGETVSDSYLYAWSELGWRPVEWLRIGLAGQRTNAYEGGRDIQRGPFAQVTWHSVTVGGYWFNPGASDQIVVGMIGVTF